MDDIVAQFQEYLTVTQNTQFGKTFAVGVLLSNKTIVVGGLSQAPPCTTSGNFVGKRKRKKKNILHRSVTD
jgi:hypothetical protein